ncbi:MAG: Trp family transcriptional regulator [Candidatus Zambryskibacteria bacterium]|nr:Trp family transcriptional regulator [Candidatus Zambryskibacteria bacterium]
MPHVSNNKLEEEHKEKLYREFLKSLERCFDAEKGLYVLGQFFTRTEREMFAKRFAVIAMLEKKIPASRIASALKMSRVTIDTMFVKHEAGKYEWVIKSALGKKNIWEIIESILTLDGSLPQKVGKGRYTGFNKMIRKDHLRKS